jgi:3-isopropylmalate/(R)-2-methylmalate dehydratase large subunit
MIAPDEKTYAYIKGREFAPKGAKFEEGLAYWKTLYSDADAKFDKTYTFDAKDIAPMITYGTNPGMGISINGVVPSLSDITEESNKASFSKSLEYVGLTSGEKLLGKKVNYVFIGSCTNSRIEDIRLVAEFVKGKQKAANITAWIVPGSKQVEAMAKAEGLDKILEAAGFKLREPGCSACLGMNEDKIPKGEYCVSTSNRNFEGRQGPGSKTFLASPLTAAATAINGYISDVRDFN